MDCNGVSYRQKVLKQVWDVFNNKKTNYIFKI